MTMTVDAQAMRIAIPAVQAAIVALDSAAGELGGISAPPGVPGALAARVTHAVSSASRDLRAKARSLDSIPDELLRRISAAQLADAPGLVVAGFTVPALKMYADSFSMGPLKWSGAAGMAMRDVFFRPPGPGQTFAAGRWSAFKLSMSTAYYASHGGPSFLPRGLTAARYAGRGLTAVNVAATAYSNFRNPYLSTGQKVGRTGAALATSAGVSIMASAAAGAAFGSAAGPVGTLVGFGAGVAWAALDKKFGVSNKIGDAAADAGEAVGDAAGAVAGGAKSVAKKALGVFGL
jgi:hypothetical protein